MTSQRKAKRAVIAGMTVPIAIATLVLVPLSGGTVRAYDSDNWMQFNSADGTVGGWGGGYGSGGYDRAFIRKWEANPRRGLPTISKDNIQPMKAAIKRYAAIVKAGGWKPIPRVKLYAGVTHPAVARLRRRLEITGDLAPGAGYYAQSFDYSVQRAVQRFQIRHGLTPTGVVDKRTLAALNVSARVRLRQLRINLGRMRSYAIGAPKRFVMVNIPAAQVEAIENNRVVSRHTAVVGKIDRRTPVLRSHIYQVNFNPMWTLPPTVIRKDLIPKGRQMRKRGGDVLIKYGIDAYDSRGRKLDPRRINWNSPAVYNYIYRQEPGKDNPMGYVKLSFHNKFAVFLHDTPSKTLFGRNFRAASSGCVRVQNIRQLVAWLLRDNEGWGPRRVAYMKQSGERMNVRLKRQMPIYMVYVTAWATRDGTVHFRRDLYRRDGVGLTASAY